jgi:hypothetical protein
MCITDEAASKEEMNVVIFLNSLCECRKWEYIPTQFITFLEWDYIDVDSVYHTNTKTAGVLVLMQ